MRWAALPTVFELTTASAQVYLQEGSSAVCFLDMSAVPRPRQQEYAVRRLRKLAAKLNVAGAHGLWLLWADRSDPAHDRLRAHLGVAPAAPGESQFAIVVMAGSRVSQTFVMRSEFSMDSAYSFCVTFLDGQLWPEGWQKELIYALSNRCVLLLAAVVCCLLLAWQRRVRRTDASAVSPPLPSTKTCSKEALPSGASSSGEGRNGGSSRDRVGGVVARQRPAASAADPAVPGATALPACVSAMATPGGGHQDRSSVSLGDAGRRTMDHKDKPD